MKYIFKCKKCDKLFTINLNASEYHEPNCPHCKGKSERVFSPTTSVWKCNGAYGQSK